MVNQRGYRILMSLVENGETVLIEDLSKQFNVSDRAIRYDLDGIDYFLKYSNFPMLIRKQNQGVSYKIEFNQLENLKNALSEYMKTFSIMSPNRRILEMILRLATSVEPIKLDNESEKIGVSKSTLFKDFEKIKALFNSKDIILESSKKGYSIVGNEIHLCFKTAKIVLNFLESEDIIEIMKFMLFDTVDINSIFDRIFNENTKLIIAEKLKYISRERQLSDENYLFACFSISLAIARKIELSNDSDFLNSLKNILSNVDFSGNCINISLLTKDFIKNIDDEIGGGFANDIVLLSSMRLEIQNKLSKIGNVNFQIEEMSQLISANQQLVVAIKKSCASIKDEFKINLEFTQAEIAKILLHFVEALDRKLYFKMDKPKVVILSPFDKSMSKMIEERVLSYFDIEVVATGDLKEISKIINEGEIDFAISTFQVYFENIITIVINPLVSNIDISNLKKILPTRVVDIFLLKRIADFSKDFVDAKEFGKYINGIKNILNIKTRDKIIEDDND